MSKRSFNKYYQDRLPLGFSCKTVSLTEQCFKDECDINNIVKKPNLGVNPFNVRTDLHATFGDFSEMKTFEEANRIVSEALNNFNALPSTIRDRFDGNIQKFADFINNPDNISEGIELGIYENSDYNRGLVSKKAEKPALEGVSPFLPETSAQVSLDVNGRTDTIQ